MSKISARTYGSLLALFALASAIALAQVVGAILTGTVTDPSGAAVPNAKVTISNVATGIVTAAFSNGAGIYNAPNLLPGDYEVSVEAAGLTQRQRARLTLTVGEKQVLNLEMQVGAAAASVDVQQTRPPSSLAALR